MIRTVRAASFILNTKLGLVIPLGLNGTVPRFAASERINARTHPSVSAIEQFFGRQSWSATQRGASVVPLNVLQNAIDGGGEA
jgi:hypothetical protein